MPRRKAFKKLSKEDWRNIRATSKKILLTGEILKHERQDIEQELAVTLWKKSRNFRSRQSSWPSFSYLVLGNSLKKIIRNRLLPSARYYHNPSLSLNLPGEFSAEPNCYSELIEQINTEGLFEDGSSKMEHDGLPLKVDMDEFIVSLSDDLQEICEHLKTMRICDAARILGISRTTIYAKIKTIRKGMLDSGFTYFF